MELPSFPEQLKAVVESLRVACPGALVTLGAVRSGAVGHILSCRCVFHEKAQTPREDRDYGDVLLRERWLSLDDALDLLLRLPEGTAEIAELKVVAKYSFTGGQIERKVAPVDGLTGWSEWRFEMRRSEGDTQSPGLYQPLVGPGLRPYKSGALAVADWVWSVGPSWSGGLPPYYLMVVVAIPDLRARVVTNERGQASFQIAVEAGVPGEEIEAQLVVHSLGGASSLPATSLASGLGAEWEVDTNATRAEVYLVDRRDGDLLWWMDQPNTGTKTRTSAIVRSIEEIAERDLVDGESERVEFKPFLIPGKEGPKLIDLAETVVAFANSAGGRIYVGVRDDSTVEGRAAFLKAAATDPAQAAEAMKTRFAKIIRDRLKPVPIFLIEVIEIRDAPILVVTVQAGEERPYATHENDIYIRKGSTDRKPDPHTELRSLYRKRRQPGPTALLLSEDDDLP